MNSNTPKPQRTGKKTQQQITNLLQQQAAQMQSTRTERNRRRRRNRKNRAAMVESSTYISKNPPSFDTKIKKEILKSKSLGISEAGLAFLKCAFAPPDFATTDVAGYPDTFNGRSLTKKHRFVLPYSFPINKDIYILLAPIPGVAFLDLAVNAGDPIPASAVWSPRYYNDFASLFPSQDTAANKLEMFRFISNHVEVIPSVNQAQWTGSIQVIKLQLSQITRNNSSSSGNIMTFTGAQACNGFGSAPQYSGPFINGAFCGAYASDSSRDFTPVQESLTTMPAVLTNADFTQIGTTTFPGLDNTFETVCIKFSGTTGNNNSAIIKTWACVEYKALPGTDLSEYERLSPNDPIALEVYRKIVNALPTAVPFYENENFWSRVLLMIKRISGYMSALPGPYGVMAGGVHGLATGIEQLML